MGRHGPIIVRRCRRNPCSGPLKPAEVMVRKIFVDSVDQARKVAGSGPAARRTGRPGGGWDGPRHGAEKAPPVPGDDGQQLPPQEQELPFWQPHPQLEPQLHPPFSSVPS
ncbi:hypothetical protein GCM10022630_00790 [Thermobifida alba]